jgi:hypothetical protein
MKVIFYLIFSLISQDIFGLVPLESLVLGDLSDAYKKEATDPLNYIFTFRGKFKIEQKRSLAYFRGFIEEGENLQNLCKVNYEINYRNQSEKDTVKRSMASALQYIGLDILVRALPQYAKFFEFSEKEYENLVNGLVGNYCSKNISIMSIRELKKNMMFNFNLGEDFPLPSIKNNQLFPKKLEEINTIDNIMEREFFQSIKLFRAFCSWGNDIDNYRLLVPILKNPTVMAFIIRQLTNKKFSWDSINNFISLKNDFNTDQVLCKGLICRKTDWEKFQNEIPRSLGSRGIKEDFAQMYCSEFSKLNFKRQNQEPKILEIIQKEKEIGPNLMTGQFLALLTGIPDFFVRSKNFSDANKFLKFNFEEDWTNWAIEQNKSFGKNLYFEEPLSLEVVSREFYFNNYLPKFKVMIDMNMGEFDKVAEEVGTVKVSYNLKIYKSYLGYIRNEWLGINKMQIQSSRDKLLENFSLTISDQVQKFRSKFRVPPWSGNLEKLIARELLTQLSEYQGSFFTNAKAELMEIPIELNYSPMALKYIYFRNFVSSKNKPAK